MAHKVTIDDIKKINEIYFKCHNYAETARQTGWSASTVRAYVDKNYNPITENEIIRFNPDTDFSDELGIKQFRGVKNYGDLCVLTNEELEEIKNLWKELSI